MSATLDDLYRHDYYAWSRQQAAELRRLRGERVTSTLDLDNLAEEVASLGRSDLRRVKSQLRRIIEHLLKLQYSPATEPLDGCCETILKARQDIDDYLTSSMRPEVEAGLEQDYSKGRAKAVLALQRYGEHEAAVALPMRSPYALAELLDPEWWPPVALPPPAEAPE
jgi:hypothetical protein